MSEELVCVHCGETVREFNFAMGREWMHVDPCASFPSTLKGTAWSRCKATTVATPVKVDPKYREKR